MMPLFDFAPPASQSRREADGERARRHKAGDHALCGPDRARHGTCSECGKTIQVTPTSAPPDRRRCRDCQRARPSRSTRSSSLEVRVCEQCDRTYVPKPMHRPDQRFCSKSCSARARGSRRRTCEICGCDFKPKRSDRADGYVQRTCSRSCGAEYRRRTYGWAGSKPPRSPSSRVYIRECVWCGKLFVGRRATTKTCSTACGRKQSWSNDARRVHKRERHCHCGQQIPLKHQRCDDCRDADAREALRQGRRRRKARQRGAKTSERYWFADIAARDRYRCGICRKRVAMTKAVPHPKAPTIDHIVPLAEGGEDTAANVRLAHFICNSARGNRGGGEQLALIG